MHLLQSFKAKFVSKHATSMVALIKKANENEEIPKSRLYLALGKSLITSPPPKSQRLPILNDVWKVVSKIEDVDNYCEIAVVFIQYLLMFFTVILWH